MQDEKILRPIPVITASAESYDAMLMAEHVLIVANDLHPDPDTETGLFSSRRCLINCNPDNVRKMSLDRPTDPRLKLMVGG